jgi:hypothetical protein
MTDPNVENLRLASNAVYLACEKEVADDLSNLLKWSADEIERLLTALEFFASDGAWLRDGPCDPNSSNFNGTNIARAALADTSQ